MFGLTLVTHIERQKKKKGPVVLKNVYKHRKTHMLYFGFEQVVEVILEYFRDARR